MISYPHYFHSRRKEQRWFPRGVNAMATERQHTPGQAVMNGCAQALRPGGWLVIIDETYPSTLAQARQPGFRFPLQTGFEELIWGNIIPTREEQERLLREAGFAGEIHRALVGEGFTLLSTQRQ